MVVNSVDAFFGGLGLTGRAAPPVDEARLRRRPRRAGLVRLAWSGVLGYLVVTLLILPVASAPARPRTRLVTSIEPRWTAPRSSVDCTASAVPRRARQPASSPTAWPTR